MTNKEKNSFRRSAKWINFREKEIDKRGLRCELFGVKITRKNAQLHHLEPEFYDNLVPEKFKLLSPTAHALVEFLAPIVYGNLTKIPRIELLLAWIGPFLPKPERTVDKYYKMMEDDYGRVD